MFLLESKYQNPMPNSLSSNITGNSNKPPDQGWNLMYTNNWRPASQGGEPVMDTGDWRNHLQPDSRQRIVNKITDTLQRHLPFPGLNELKKIAGRFEEKIYTAATSQMLSMDSKSQNPMPNSLPSNTAGNSNKPPDQGTRMECQVHDQGQSLPIPMSANQSQPHQQLLSQNIQNNMTSNGVSGSSGLPSALPSVSGLSQAPMPSVVNQNSTMQNISGASQNMVSSMGQGAPSNLCANTQMQMQGRQLVLPPQQQQQSQNPHQYMYQQQLQQQFLKQKLQHGNLSHSLMQPHMHQQQPNILQPNQLQSSQQSGMQSSSVMQPSLIQSAPLSRLQQNQQRSVQQWTQSMMQPCPQSVLRPQHGTGMQNQVHNQGQPLPIPLSANQSQPCQQLFSQYIQNNMTSTGLPVSSGLPFLLPSVSGLTKTPIPSVVNQNSTVQNISGVSQNTLPSLGQGVPSNLFANSQREMQAMLQVLPQLQRHQSQNPQQHMPSKAAFTKPAAPITLPSMMPSQKQRQQLMGQLSNAANMLQNQLIGKQYSVGDIEQQLHQRTMGKQMFAIIGITYSIPHFKHKSLMDLYIQFAHFRA
ncbi:hypothetical protein Patl1_34638 [Pistacia atlantica]|uniref:Uncharacterized protein n=1 Tax=Pistacia atlantica TaxID=434234 RepID=A0ACC0ZSR8_9ROSI|nr:hypothetical protein Patl1_34638 [Pistacia atlantica]